MIRVCLVDDHELVRAGIASLLGFVAGVEVVAEASDGVEALEVIERARPDVVLLDVRLPRLDGLAVLRELQRSGSSAAVVLLTTFDDDRVLREGLETGALGFLLKDATTDQLAAAIKSVAAGQTYLQPRASSLQDRLDSPEFDSRPIDDLSQREIEVLRFVARGFSNAEIARALDLAEGTVKNHVSNVLSKLGVRDRTRAALVALDRGLI